MAPGLPKRAHIGIVDKLYSRLGAATSPRGRSTFMVEMIETAAILNQANERSLVILDEIGRGTATFDGLSIAWAVMSICTRKIARRALFATHFHELTRLAEKLDRLVNLTVRVTDWNGEVVFLHEIVPGAADRSYGIQVAKLAGLPAPAVSRAKELLAEFEAAERLYMQTGRLPICRCSRRQARPRRNATFSGQPSTPSTRTNSPRAQRMRCFKNEKASCRGAVKLPDENNVWN